MRLAGFKSALFGAIALVMLGAGAGCENPFDPLGETGKIEGLTYIDFSAGWDRWDSDPYGDGLVVTLSYSNEYGDGLAFHDKSHKVVIEFWTQKDRNADVDGATTSYMVMDKLFYSKTIQFSNSDDDIRIPIEAYYDQMMSVEPDQSTEDTPWDFTGFIRIRVFPPEQYPRTELVVAMSGQTFYEPPKGEEEPP
jgi:hypothetical protein